MFPDGSPGAGLLLMRSAAGTILIVQSIAWVAYGNLAGILMPAIACVMTLLGLLLLIGFLTRFVALAAAAASLVCASSWLPASRVGPLMAPMTAVLSAIIAVVVTCMGPGAFSLDASVFGRRKIIIPANVREKN